MPKFNRENVRATCVQLLPALARDCAWPIDCYTCAIRLSFAVRDRLRPDLKKAAWRRHFAERIRPIASEVLRDFQVYLARLDRLARTYSEVLAEHDITPEPARVAQCCFQHLYPTLVAPSYPVPAGLRQEKMRMICWYLLKNKIGTAVA